MTTLEILSVYQILKEENERAYEEYQRSINDDTVERLKQAIDARTAFENHEWE